MLTAVALYAGSGKSQAFPTFCIIIWDEEVIRTLEKEKTPEWVPLFICGAGFQPEAFELSVYLAPRHYHFVSLIPRLLSATSNPACRLSRVSTPLQSIPRSTKVSATASEMPVMIV
jgi:hypothetical protein